jgi:uncharacterized phage-associated protein
MACLDVACEEGRAHTMIISRDREKLIQAINFFVRNTKKCAKVKLFKLLYFLDFEHFKQTGRSVTDLQYFAWPMGPVPVSLNDEFGGAPGADLVEAFNIEKRPYKDGWVLALDPRIQFSTSHFSKREITILKNLAEEYRDADAECMVEATHLENLPWDEVYNREGRKQQHIPYDLAARKDERDMIMKIANDRNALLERLR